MTGLDAAIPEMGGDNSDYDTRQMIFNTIQKQEKKKSLNLKLTIQEKFEKIFWIQRVHRSCLVRSQVEDCFPRPRL